MSWRWKFPLGLGPATDHRYLSLNFPPGCLAQAKFVLHLPEKPCSLVRTLCTWIQNAPSTPSFAYPQYRRLQRYKAFLCYAPLKSTAFHFRVHSARAGIRVNMFHLPRASRGRPAARSPARAGSHSTGAPRIRLRYPRDQHLSCRQAKPLSPHTR